MKKANEVMTYMTPIFLWSVVVIHSRTVERRPT